MALPSTKTGNSYALWHNLEWKSEYKVDGTQNARICRLRVYSSYDRLGNAQPDRETWKKAYELYIQAFQSPVKDIEKKKLARLIKKPSRKEVQEWLFDYDAFLRGLGRMSLS